MRLSVVVGSGSAADTVATKVNKIVLNKAAILSIYHHC